MAFWKKRKKKEPLFGAHIEANCAYCQNNLGQNGEVLCAVRMTLKEGKRKKFSYNPLLRAPRSAPPLQTGRYRPEDFEL